MISIADFTGNFSVAQVALFTSCREFSFHHHHQLLLFFGRWHKDFPSNHRSSPPQELHPKQSSARQSFQVLISYSIYVENDFFYVIFRVFFYLHKRFLIFHVFVIVSSPLNGKCRKFARHVPRHSVCCLNSF